MIDRQRLHSIVRRAGALAMASWPGAVEQGGVGEAGLGEAGAGVGGAGLSVWDKADKSPVSAADLAVDAFLRAELGALLPSAGWLSEETVDDPAQRKRDLIWLVDPIDGTRDYIHGRPGWAVSVALINTARPLLGMLCAPARGEFWYGEAGQGSWRNGTRLVASQRQTLPGARVPAKVLGHEDGDLIPVEQPNSIALRIAMVASGEADLLASLRWGFEWDIGAAALIAREAGAAVTDAFGHPLNYNKHDPRAFGVLVTAPAIHEAAVERLAERARRLA